MEKLLTLQEMKFFNLRLKNFCYLGEPFRVFCHCFFGCFHFFMFWLIPIFLFMIWFVYFTISSPLLLLLLLLFLPQVLRIWKSILYSQIFFTLNSFLLLSRVPWDFLKIAGLTTEIWNTDLIHLFVWITQWSATIWQVGNSK